MEAKDFADNLLAVLKEKGIFSEYLPEEFNMSCDWNLYSSPASKSDYVEPYKYSMSRMNQGSARRTIAVPDIASHVAMMNYLQDNKSILEEILTISYEDNASFSKIISEEYELMDTDEMYFDSIFDEDLWEEKTLNEDMASVEEESSYSKYIRNFLKKINISQGAVGILRMDISNFYGSIYTHIMPAIKLGTEMTMKIYNGQIQDDTLKTDYMKYKKLDEFIRGQNGNRTNGLLVGPFISKVFSEAVLSRVDKEITDAGIAFTRYADDYEVYIYDINRKDEIQGKIESILEKYYLRINNEKLSFEKYPFYIFKNFERIISQIIMDGQLRRGEITLPKDLTMEEKKTAKRLEGVDIVELFNKFLELEKSGQKGAVRYLLKAYASKYEVRNKSLYGSYLLNVLMNDEKALGLASKIIIKEFQSGQITIQDGFRDVIAARLSSDLDRENDLEVIWLAYLLKKIKYPMPEELLNKLFEKGNDLAKILALHEWRERIPEEKLLECFEKASSWILLYELCLILTGKREEFYKKAGIVKNVQFYDKLLNKKFSFYKENLNGLSSGLPQLIR